MTDDGWLGLQGWVGVGIFTAALCAISVISVLTAKETYKTPTADLGRKDAAVGV